jgi:hypothetical protein
MRLLSLCSGYEGISLGLETLFPVELAYVADIDPGACKILAHRFPEVPNLGDLTKIDWDKIPGMPWRLSPEQKQAATGMYDAGMSIQQVADYYGVTRQGMWDILRRRTTMRPQLKFGADNHFYRGGSTADDHAQNLVEWALASGALLRPETCSQCGGAGPAYSDGRAAIQAHHPDYNKPLDVMWLCKTCHHQWHIDNVAVPLRKRGDADGSTADIDILSAGFP